MTKQEQSQLNKLRLIHEFCILQNMFFVMFKKHVSVQDAEDLAKQNFNLKYECPQISIL